jgi:hypothetical protein
MLLLHKEIAANAQKKQFTIRFSFKKTPNYATLDFVK